MHPTRSAVDREIPTLAEQAIIGAEAGTFNIPGGGRVHRVTYVIDARGRDMLALIA